MKKILLAAVAALAIVGCSQNEEIEKAGEKAEINVGTVVKTGTKAVVTDNGNFNAFTVKAYVVEEANIATSGLGTVYMDADYTGGQSKWTTSSGTFYWPLDNTTQKLKEMHFFAYPTTNPKMSYSDTNKGNPTLSFAVGATADEQKDLVVAYAKVVDNIPSGNTLALTFKHVLTRINFAYKPEKGGYTHTITEIKINDVSGGTATYTYNAATPWSAGNNSNVTYEYPLIDNPVKETDSDFYPLGKADGALVLLPQDVANKTITITYTTADSNYTYFSGTKTVTLPAGAKWEAGKNIRYKLTLPLGAEEIKVSTQVEDVNEGGNEVTPDTPVTPAE